VKQELLQTLAAGRAREAELARQCDDTPADPAGRWSAKDHLVHLTAWRDYAASVLDATRTGSGDQLPQSEDVDAFNARVYEANKDRAAADVTEEAQASWDRLEAAVEACTEEDLARPHPRNRDLKVWATVPANGHGHVAEHLTFRLLDDGDDKAAEAVRLWAHDVDYAAFPEPNPRAYSDYNLACFFGKVGRADRAAALLRGAFKAAPELEPIARRDTDFDGIRNSPEMRELLPG
jgi:hypothetical protein